MNGCLTARVLIDPARASDANQENVSIAVYFSICLGRLYRSRTERGNHAGTDHDASTHKIALPNACFTDRGFVCGSDLRLCSGQLRSFKGRARQPEIGKRSTLVELAIVSGGSDLLLKANVIISDGRG